MDGNRRVPDLDPLVAEVFRPGDEACLPHQGQAHELAGDAFHAGRDVRDDRGVDESVDQKEGDRKIRDQPHAQQHVGEGRTDVDPD